MKWISLACAAAFAAAVPLSASAAPPRAHHYLRPTMEKRVWIGNLPQVEGPKTADWAMSGYNIFTVRTSLDGRTPYMRTAVYDARLVEILSRVQTPPLRASDIRVIRHGSRNDICVRGYLLADVTERDARAAETTLPQLTDVWLRSARRVIPQVAPQPSQFGI